MENAYTKWKEMQTEIRYEETKDPVTIQHKAFRGEEHIATIVVWSHKVNKSCMLIWKNGMRTTQLCGSEQHARDIVDSYIDKTEGCI